MWCDEIIDVVCMIFAWKQYSFTTIWIAITCALVAFTHIFHFR